MPSSSLATDKLTIKTQRCVFVNGEAPASLMKDLTLLWSIVMVSVSARVCIVCRIQITSPYAWKDPMFVHQSRRRSREIQKTFPPLPVLFCTPSLPRVMCSFDWVELSAVVFGSPCLWWGDTLEHISRWDTELDESQWRGVKIPPTMTKADKRGAAPFYKCNSGTQHLCIFKLYLLDQRVSQIYIHERRPKPVQLVKLLRVAFLSLRKSLSLRWWYFDKSLSSVQFLARLGATDLIWLCRMQILCPEVHAGPLCLFFWHVCTIKNRNMGPQVCSKKSTLQRHIMSPCEAKSVLYYFALIL